MRNARLPEPTLVHARDRLRETLPATWSIGEPVAAGPLDGQLRLTSSAGDTVTFDVELKRWTTAPASQLRGILADRAQRTPRPILLVSDYLNRPMREACEAHGVSYLDAMGWMLLSTEQPSLFVRVTGKERPAPRTANEVIRLNGVAAGRVIRTLLSTEPPVGVRELAQLAGVKSPGSVSKILPTLAAADAIDRDESGRVTQIRQRRLLDRWTQDYSYLRSNSISLDYLDPRGIHHAVEGLEAMGGVRFTGSYAAHAYLERLSPAAVPVVPTTRLTLYADDLHQVRHSLGLHRVDRRQANVLMTTPRDKAILQSGPDDPPSMAPLSQVLADLMALPGREFALAEQLIDQLARTTGRWLE